MDWFEITIQLALPYTTHYEYCHILLIISLAISYSLWFVPYPTHCEADSDDQSKGSEKYEKKTLPMKSRKMNSGDKSYSDDSNFNDDKKSKTH